MKTRAWFRTHSFTGVITGLLLFVICFSGTFAVFAPEFDWLVTPGARVSPQAEMTSWGSIQDAARSAVPGGEVQSMEAPLNRYATAKVTVKGDDGQSRVVHVDPYSGEVTNVSSHLYDVKRFFRNFHRVLFLPGIGIYLVCAFAVTMLLSMTAALFFYKRWWRRFFSFRPKPGRALWSELHKLAGLWSLWFVLVIGLTGAWYLFEAGRADFGDSKLNYAGTEQYAAETIPAPPPSTGGERQSLDALIERVNEAWPTFRIEEMGYGWYSGNQRLLYLGGQDRFPLVRSRANQVQIDTETGEIIWMNTAGEMSPYWIWSNMADPLHFGDFGGWISKTFWFVFGLLLSGLILTGTWLHAHRIAGAGRGRHRWPGTLASIGVTLLILSASGVFGYLDALRNYGIEVDGVPQLPPLPGGAQAVIFGWIALTIAIIAAWTVLLWRPEWILPSEKRDRKQRSDRRSERRDKRTAEQRSASSSWPANQRS